MMGSTHARSGQAVWAVGCAVATVAGHHPHPVIVVGGTWLAGVAAYAPDIDHPGSTAARCLGWMSRAVAWLVSIVLGHRGMTHTAAATGIVSGFATAVGVAGAHAVNPIITGALHWPAGHGWWVGLAVGAGYLAALAGDAATVSGIPFWAPLRRRHVYVLPSRLLMRTGYGPELVGVAPVLAALVAISAEVWVVSLAGEPVTEPTWWTGVFVTGVVYLAAMAGGMRRLERCRDRRYREMRRRIG